MALEQIRRVDLEFHPPFQMGQEPSAASSQELRIVSFALSFERPSKYREKIVRSPLTESKEGKPVVKKVYNLRFLTFSRA
jgi:hypothetical protein